MKTKPPRVRLAKPKGRPIQLRYTCPDERREIRITTATRDEAEALQEKEKLEAQLLLGIKPTIKKPTKGPQMLWEDFREEYRTLHIATLREKSQNDAESRLDVAERILKPRTLADVASSEALHQLQTKLLKGEQCRYERQRSPHTVRTMMGAVIASLRWAWHQGWISSVPPIRRIKTSKLRSAKGRPLSGEEFEKMTMLTAAVVGGSAAGSYRHILNGLWESGLRLGELMHMSWDMPNTIQPVWHRGRLPVLTIPASMQKNDTEEAIPMLPAFEALLLKTPEAQRTGWIFNPHLLRPGKKIERPSAEWVGKMITKIGEKAGVIVDTGDETKGRPKKFASAHDLRRSCAERMLDAGVPPMVIARVLRHASWETTKRHYATGNVQKDAGKLRACLGTLFDSVDVTQYTPEDSNL